MKQFIIVTISIFFISTYSTDLYSQHRKTKWLDGTWTGLGYQPDVMSSWKIRLDYNYTTKEIKIYYSTFPCGGYWKLEKASRNKAVFTEYISNGVNKCQNKSTIIVTKINEKFVAVSYFYPEFTKRVIAFSTLEKED